MPTLSLLALLIACGGGSEAPAEDGAATEPTEEATPAPEAAPSADSHEAVLKALAVRKPEPSCQKVDQLAKDPVAAYKTIIATEKDPPYVPMRAATCLLSQHPREGEAEAVIWAGQEDAAMLTMAAIGRLDTMPLDSAKKIAKAALEGPHKDQAKMRIARLRTPELKAMAGGAP